MGPGSFPTACSIPQPSVLTLAPPGIWRRGLASMQALTLPLGHLAAAWRLVGE